MSKYLKLCNVYIDHKDMRCIFKTIRSDEAAMKTWDVAKLI